MAGIRFGPAGMSELFYESGHKASVEAPTFLRGLGLSAYEYSFGRGVRIGEATANAIAAEAEKHDVQISVHAPYFINLVVEDEKRRASNLAYFMDTARAAKAMGAKRAVFHPGARSSISRESAMATALPFLKEILDTLEQSGYAGVAFCAETMGKVNQFGDLEEVIEICRREPRVLPAIDFAHLHALGRGALNSKADFAAILDKLENGVGLERARNMHVHFSKIEFTAMGEKKHHDFSEAEYGPEFAPLAQLLVERGYSPVMINESKQRMVEDALAMRDIYIEAGGAV